MPSLANMQMEEFCHHLAAGNSQSEAARKAGYSPKNAHNLGSRMSKREDVRHRITELTGSSDQDTVKVAGRSWIVSETVQLHRDARAKEQYAVSKQCLEFLAKLQGYLVERSERYSEQHRVFHAPTDVVSALSGHLKALPEAERVALAADPDIIEVLADDASTVQGSE